jgi:hypothetical protein
MHAQVAATYAFVRAQERSSADEGYSNANAKFNSNPLSRQPSLKTSLQQQHNEHPIMRPKQSVRFAGANAVPEPPLKTRASQPKPQHKASTGSLRPRAITNDVPVPAAYRPQSRSSSIGKASLGLPTGKGYLETLAAYDEYYTREDDVASTPSSYRRIRKSKSSFLGGSTLGGVLFNNGTPESEWKRPRSRVFGEIDQSRLKGAKSMSFLRGRARVVPDPDHDLAVQVARDKFLQQVEEQRLRSQPSCLFRANKRRQEQKPFRQSLRDQQDSSTNSYGMPIASEKQNPSPKDGTLRSRARKASQTIKNRLISLFKRSPNQEEAQIPDQEVQANRSHISEYQIGAPSMHHADGFLDVAYPDTATVSRVSSRQPSLHAVPSHQQLRSNCGSLESLRSAASSRSRVTSWSNSVETTMASRHATAERERQRLSIIQENGTHVTGSSFTRPSISNQFSPYPAFNRPSSAHGHPPSIVRPVDSQRVYSALMKRLDETSPKAILKQRSSIGSLKTSPKIPVRSSSVSSCHSSISSGTPTTVRKAYNSPVKPSVPHQVSNHRDDVFVSKDYPESGTLVNLTRNISNASTVIRKPSYSSYPPPVMGNFSIPTPQQQALRNEPILPTTKALRETRSTFFGKSDITNISRTASPYRRAMQASEHCSAGASMGIRVVSNAGETPPPGRTTEENVPDTLQVIRKQTLSDTYSESVYSRTTSGYTPPADRTFAADRSDQEGQEQDIHGSMLVVDRATYRPTPPSRRLDNSGGSVEWKEWMSAQVSSLDKSKDNGAVKIKYAMPSMPRAFGHVREHADISGEDTGIATRKISKVKQPLGIVQQNTKPRPILKNKASAFSFDMQSFPQPPAGQQPQGGHSLQLTSSRALLYSVNPVGMNPSSTALMPIEFDGNTHQLLRKKSNTTLRSVKTPAKLQRRSHRPSSNLNTPSPGISAAVEKQFGSAGERTPYSGTENFSPDNGYGVEEAGLMGPSAQLDAQAMGSKRMVDLFLSSRRRRVAGSDESHAFI